MTSGIHVEIVMMNSSIQPIHIASHHKKNIENIKIEINTQITQIQRYKLINLVN